MFIYYRSLKIGGEEILREKWDEATGAEGDTTQDPSLSITSPTPVSTQETEANLPLRSSTMTSPHRATSILPDWTRVPLGAGAPHVPRRITTSAQQTVVGA